MTETLRREMGLALRSLRRTPGFSLMVVLTLAVGLGAATSVYSIVSALLLRPLPFADPDRLVLIESVQGGASGHISLRELEDLRERTDLFVDIAAYRPPGGGYTMSDGDGPPYEASAVLITHNLFSVLGVPLAHGRTWPREYDLERSFGVVLSHSLYRQRFGDDRSVFERTIALDGAPNYRVFGVTPPGFDFPVRSDLYRSIFINARAPNLVDRDARGSIGVARLRPGVSVEAARQAVSVFGRRLSERFPDTNRSVDLTLRPLQERYIGDVRPYLLVLGAAVALVLLMSWVNAANLLLARSLSREGELAIRAALGAGRTRIALLMMAESVVLALAGGLLGIALAFMGVRALTQVVRFDLPSWMIVQLDGSAILVALLLSLLTAAAAGTLPALRLSSADSLAAIRAGGGKGAAGSLRARTLSRGLVAGEVALALILLAGTELTLRTFRSLTTADPGLDTVRALSFKVNLPWFLYDGPKAEQFHAAVLENLRRLPNAQAAALTTNLPFAGPAEPIREIAVAEGQEVAIMETNPLVDMNIVSAGYFASMGVALLAGREFTAEDRAQGRRIAVVTRTLAERFWPGQDPVGRRLRLATDTAWREVVGVVADVHPPRIVSPDLQLYVPAPQAIPFNVHFLVRFASGDPRTNIAAVERAVWAVDPLQPIWDVHTLEERRTDILWRERASGLLFGVFAIVALVLAAGGIYGIMSFTVGQRTREIGIRMALGARSSRVLTGVLAESSRIALVGIGAGLLGAAATIASMTALLPTLEPWNPLSVLGVAVSLVMVAALAALVPARRAARLAPVSALRQ